MLSYNLTPASISKFLLKQYPHAKGYTKFVLRWRSYCTPVEEVIKRVPISTERAIDVGCGRGMLPILLFAGGRVKNILGIDVSENAILVAQDAVSGFNGIDFQQVASFTDWPQMDTFDIVLCIDTLHHVSKEQQEEFLRRVSRLCAPGGMLIFEDVSPSPRWRSSINTCMDLILSRQLVHYWYPKKIQEIFNSEGFMILENTFISRLWNGYYIITARKNL